jgi:peptidoglycan/LPS O-acetylase OafA/YrhL
MRRPRWDEMMLLALKRTPLTILVFIITLLLGLLTEANEQYFGPLFLNRFGWDITTLQAGHYYAPWLSLFTSVEQMDFYFILLLLVLTVGVLEYRRGTRLAAFGFFLIGPLASVMTSEVLWAVHNAGTPYVNIALFTPDMGSSTSCLACLGILLTGENIYCRKTLIFGVLVLLVAAFHQKLIYNFDHLDGYLAGLETGGIMYLWNVKHKKKTNI